MNACSKCNGSGFVAICVEPMAGLAGYEKEACPTCNGPAQPEVSPLEAAWAERDRLGEVYDRARDAQLEAERRSQKAYDAYVAQHRVASAIGPRPAKVAQ